MYSTQPGIQFYTGNFFTGQVGKNGMTYEKHGGFALEPQHFPDNINQVSTSYSIKIVEVNKEFIFYNTNTHGGLKFV